MRQPTELQQIVFNIIQDLVALLCHLIIQITYPKVNIMPFVLDKRKVIVLLPIPPTQLGAMKILGKLANQSPIFLVSGVLYKESFESVVSN